MSQRAFSIRCCWMALIVATLLVPALALMAADKETPSKKTPYATLGSPVRAKVAAQWNRYHDYTEATELLKELAKAHPQRCRLVSLGESYEKRGMWLVTITNFATGDAEKKSAFWIDGGIHANEIQSVEVPLYTAWYLLEMAEQNEIVNQLLNERTFYIMPMMSPDSRDAHFYEPNSTNSPRTGQRPVDDDKDGLVDEDGADDLDGDGHITQMRVRDPQGEWKPHADFPQLMVRVKPGEKGEFRLLGPEGLDNDDDGRVNEDGDGNYDPNRNFPWNWQPEYVQGGAHRYPLSLLEDRLVADFWLAHGNIAGAQSYHNAGGMILRGPGAKSDAYDGDDLRVYETIGKKGEEILPGYKLLNIANDLYEVHGGEVDFLHQLRGAYTFTNELFTPFNYFRRPEHGGWFGSDETQRLFDKYLLFGDGVAGWREFQHPVYGKVEIGGAKKSWVRQPPAFLLEEECHRNMAFTLYHADQMPRVKVSSIAVETLPGDLVRITAAIENDRLCPTHSAADLKRKLSPPDLVTISAANLKVLVGWYDGEPFFLSPTEQSLKPAQLKIPNVPGHSTIYVRWLAQGPGPYTVEVTSQKGGTHAKTSP